MQWKKRAVGTVLICLCCSGAAMAEPLEGSWEKLHGKLSTAVGELERRVELPATSWVPFTDSQEKVDEEIDDLLNGVIVLLGDAEVTRLKRAIDELQEQLRSQRSREAELKTRRIAAPEKVAAWKLWKKDQQKIDEDLAELAGEQKQTQAALEQNIDALTAAIRALGINIDHDQVETLIYSVTGDDDIMRIAVFNNIKLITTELQRLTQESEENPEMARRYYGMHTLLLRSLLKLYGQCLGRIEGEYLPQIGDVVKRQSLLIEETKRKMADEPPQFRTIYSANLDAQRLTIRTARLYGGYLLKNEGKIATALEKINHEYLAAMNTWQTVQAARDLITLMQNADTMLGRLSALQTPELLIFDNLQMKQEFRKLSESLAK